VRVYLCRNLAAVFEGRIQMGETGFVQIISFVAVASFAVIFLLISAYAPAFRFARWFAAAFFLGASVLLFSFYVASVDNLAYPGLIRAFLTIAASSCGLIGIMQRCGIQPPWRLLGAGIAAATTAAFLTVEFGAPAVLRSVAFHVPPAIIHLTGGMIFLRRESHRLPDWLIGGVLIASTLNFLSRPTAIFITSGWGATAQLAFVSQNDILWKSAGAIIGVLLGLIVISQFLRDIVSRSQIDMLSALLNRAAFEEKVEERLKDIHKSGVPACLIVADLDRFKLINDRFGHAAGDEVIAGFAEIIRQAQTGQVIAGRLGGEEFGIFLEGANLTSAELFAESVRAAFSVTAHTHVPAGTWFTASLGVAQVRHGQTLPDLMRRADAALYDAKTGGRDQVRLAPSVQMAPEPFDWRADQDLPLAS
jgi:diguanylate cyclase (GGDEF)-like protein